MYSGADNFLAQPGKNQANVSVRISFGALPWRVGEVDEISRLDVVEIARVRYVLPSLFPSCSV